MVLRRAVFSVHIFFIYINDLCNIELTNRKIITFADNIALLFHADTWEEVNHLAQRGSEYSDGFMKTY